MNFKVGDKVTIVGTNSGCPTKRCKDCLNFKGKVLIITKIYDEDYDKERTVAAKAKGKYGFSNCHFNPLDLKLVRIDNWRERIK